MVSLVAVTIFGLSGSAAVGQQHPLPAQAMPVAATTDPAAPTAEEMVLDFGDDQRRMTVPVSIGTNGPYSFIVDTGAERTVVSRELAGTLKLASGRIVRVTAMANVVPVETAIVPGLRVSKIAHSTIEAPMLEYRNLGAVGMLGIDALQGHSVSIDFDKNQMTLAPSKKKRSRFHSPDEIVVHAKNLYGQLIVTDARYRGKRIAVVIDTGSAITVANTAMLHLFKKQPKSLGKIALLSATGAWLNADYCSVDMIEIGGMGFRNVPLAFADAKPFARFDLKDTPALMLGMDTLRLFRRVQIDFANREVRFTLPRGAQVSGAAISGI